MAMSYRQMLDKIDEVAKLVKDTLLPRAAFIDGVTPERMITRLHEGHDDGRGASALVDKVYEMGSETSLGPAFITLVFAKVAENTTPPKLGGCDIW